MKIIMIITSIISNYDHKNDNQDNVIIDQDDAIPLYLMMSIRIITISFLVFIPEL